LSPCRSAGSSFSTVKGARHLRPNPPFEQVDIAPDAIGVSQALALNAHPFAWIMRASPDVVDRPWIIFFHGKGSTVAERLCILHYERLRQLGLNVFAPGLIRGS
jgi:hypothetical protein